MSVEILVAFLAVMLASIVQGAVGFGFGMLAAPVVAFVDPSLVPAPLVATALVLTLLMSIRERSGIVFHEIGWALLGRVPGTVLGAATIMVASQQTVSLLVGIVVCVSVGLIVSGARVKRSRPTLLAAGVASGFMSTTTSIGGPPVAALYHNEGGRKFRAAMSAFFVVGLSMSLTALVAVGRFRAPEIRAAGWLIPAAVAGFWISGYVIPVLDRGHTRKAVLIVSALAGASVIGQALGAGG